ncbi:hypothetical protein SAMN02745824_2267 [Parasphingorhabdus marina DSM 22363]|uniref:Uncharacterized protein n=1 Tax=Parasphingorhabdus marina DSM 22363 TaxID=1123272 RepID=A0A1N6F705_9SPHN|nr:hypothetical protein [Parasphingorhabdus marina]SIN91088.1 hypothetical protein SAMN02745824_2267 [Parasphingorhabdus marina DSM 22363]
MISTLEFSSFPFRDHEEFCLIAGASCEQQLLLIPPLFDEMNRMRQVLVDVMRRLEKQGIGSVFPDLPGSNESVVPSDQASLSMWQEALVRCLETFDNLGYVAGVRGGCLIDAVGPDLPHWRLTPVDGQRLLRTMMRTRVASDKEAGVTMTISDLTEQAAHETLNLAGNAINPGMFAELQAATPDTLKTVRQIRLNSDPKEADDKIDGSALWLRAEPESDPALAEAISQDISEWIRS